MSCGDSQETDCRQVLAELWMFLDNECDRERRELLQRHLDECGPCLEEYGLEEHLKALLARKCRGDHAPDALKQRLRESIREIMLRQAMLCAEVTVTRIEDGTVVEVSTVEVSTMESHTVQSYTVESRTWTSTEG